MFSTQLVWWVFLRGRSDFCICKVVIGVARENSMCMECMSVQYMSVCGSRSVLCTCSPPLMILQLGVN